MAISPDIAQSLIKEFYLMGRAIRIALAHPVEGQLLPGGIGVLGALESKGPCRQVDLAVDMCISASALSRHVTELAGEGYISRHADPTDGRATLIRVTDEGRDLLQRVQASRARGLQTVLADWREEEAEQACLAVQKLRNTLTAHAHTTSLGSHQPVSMDSKEVDV
ncbi:MarR family transcriptional regulator [Nocardia sp. R6R-6]|uniref:MarR family transcriptional regulator n=1 Tax=Nocardia sp. R6R-6 TaxID=3459303 RepID=UPI00403D5FFD